VRGATRTEPGRTNPSVPLEALRAAMAVNPKKLRPYDTPTRRHVPLIPDGPNAAATVFLVAAIVWLVAATGIGVLWAGMQLFPDLLSLTLSVPTFSGTLEIVMSPATVGAGFWNAVVFGWLSNAGLGAILFITPRVLGQRLVGEQVGAAAAGLWNVGMLAGLTAIYVPSTAATGTLAEFPLPVDAVLLLALLLVNDVFWRTGMSARERAPYASVWFFGVALLGFTVLYAVGTLVPLVSDGTTFAALVGAAYARGLETVWVLGVAFGVLYYIVPRATGNALHSSGVALLGWLTWAVLAVLAPLAALVDSSVPFSLTQAGNAATIMLVIPAFLAIANLLLSLRGRWTLLLSPGTVQYAMVALAFLATTALLEALSALGSVRDLIGGTEWTVGVRFFAFFGATTFALLALTDHAFPRLLRRDWGGTIVTTTTLWATFAGTAISGLSLIAGGVVHGSLLRGGAAPEEIEATLFWTNAVAGSGLGLVALGGLAAALNVFLMYTDGRRAEYAVGATAAASASAGQ